MADDLFQKIWGGLKKLYDFLVGEFGKIDRRLAAIEAQNAKLNEALQLLLSEPSVKGKHEFEHHKMDYKTAGLQVFFSSFPRMWADEDLKEDYREAVRSLKRTQDTDVLEVVAGLLFDWALNLRGNMLRSPLSESTPFAKAVKDLVGYSEDEVQDGKADEDITLILKKYFREASKAPLPDQIDELIKAKIESWRMPFLPWVRNSSPSLTEAIASWKASPKSGKRKAAEREESGAEGEMGPGASNRAGVPPNSNPFAD